MAEIKSTIDIVMERTKHMVQSDEEKARARAGEREKKIRGFLLGLREERISPDDLPRLLEEASEGDLEAFRSGLVRAAVEGLGLEGKHGPALRGIEVMAGGRLGGMVRTVRTILNEYETWKAGVSEQAQGDVLAQLAAIGVTGSALQPKPGGDAGFSSRLEEMGSDYSRRLLDVKRTMLDSAES